MEFVQYLIVSVIAYIGLAAGYALAHISPEEMKPGKKYFEAVHLICFILIMLLLFYFKSPQWAIIALIAVAVYIKIGKGKAAQKITYGILGAMFALYSQEQVLFRISAGIIFIFGLASGTLSVIRHSNKSRIWQFFYLLGSNALFFLTALPLYFLDFHVIG